MSFKDALAKAREARPEPTLIPIVLGDKLYSVEIVRLDGMDWAGIVAECPIQTPVHIWAGFDVNKAALLACSRYSRVLDGDEPVSDVDWEDLFKELSGEEVRGLAATWWSMNVLDPNQRVAELKKASTGGDRTS